jgi:uncharacterized protein DUF1801
MTAAKRKARNAQMTRLSPAQRKQLVALRKLVLDTAKKTNGVGTIEEAVKWGQPSFLTRDSGSGSTVRIDATKSGGTAMYFHCQTNLVETFRKFYPDDFTFEGNRALHFDGKKKLPEKALRHCIALALTYHARKAQRPS